MKQVTITAFCDGNHQGLVESAVERTVTVDGSKPVVLDLCPECDKAIQALLALMDQGAVLGKGGVPQPAKPKARKRAPAAPKTGEHVCPMCGFVSSTRAALGQHLRHRHDKGFTDLKNEEVEQARLAS